MAPTTAESNTMPVKTRDVLNHHMDSTIWDELKLRQDDIVITTYAKSGTTVRLGVPALKAFTDLS